MSVSLGALGFLMVAVFMLVVILRWTSAVVALILIPIVFSVLGGFGARTGTFMLAGLSDVAPTAVMLIFAVLYFGLMIDAGLFRPLVARIVQWAGDHPSRATLGHAALASGVGLDGSGATTFLVCASSLRPVYRRLGIGRLEYATIGVLGYLIVHVTPWGGPAARISAALHVNPAALSLPLLPVAAVGLVAVYLGAWMLGHRRRDVAAGAVLVAEEETTETFETDPVALRPRLVWVNFALTVALMVAVVLRLAPLPALFMIGTAMALLVNYPGHKEQRERLRGHGANALDVGLLVLAAGAFTGVMKETGMTDAMAHALIAILPPGMGPHLGLVTALLSLPANVFLSSDAFYFGVVPVLARSAAQYGIPPEAIGRAALLGVPLHGLSPLVGAVYLNCALAGVELGDLQRFAWKYALALSVVLILGAVAFGAITI